MKNILFSVARKFNLKSKRNRWFISCALLFPLLLLFQNCGNGGFAANESLQNLNLSSENSQGDPIGPFVPDQEVPETEPDTDEDEMPMPIPDVPPPIDPVEPTVGGFNNIRPVITKGIGNQSIKIGLTGNLSGTKGSGPLIVEANPGAGEEFQNMILRCTATGAGQIDLTCNNAAFVNGRATVSLDQDDAECLQGSGTVTYWVVDRDPGDINQVVPQLESDRRTFNFTMENTCYSEKKVYGDEVSSQDNFGFSVKQTANFLFVSAPGDDAGVDNSGAVQVFERESGGWRFLQLVKLSESESGTKISVVGASGNWVALGSPFSRNESGTINLFEFNGSQFVKRQTILGPSSQYGFDQFGYSVAIDDDRLVVGAPNASGSGKVANGAVYFYQRSGASWSQVKKVEGELSYEQLGYSVDVDGPYVLAGAPANFPEHLGRGQAYLIDRSGNFIDHLPPGVGADAQSIFGQSVAVQNDKLFVGAPLADARRADSGAVYYYRTDGNQVIPEQKIQSSDGSSKDSFGYSLSSSNGHLVVGARRNSDDDAYRQGSAYHFKLESNQWQQKYKIKSQDRVSRDYFGSGVSVFGNEAIIGSPLDDGKSNENLDGAGAVYVYQLQ